MKDESHSLSTDLLTCAVDPYITIIAHYITDSWELKSRVLQTTIMHERHTTVNIAQRLNETMEEWGLVIFCTIHVNASSMNLAMEQFPHHLGCTRYTLQLAIKAGLNLTRCCKTCCQSFAPLCSITLCFEETSGTAGRQSQQTPKRLCDSPELYVHYAQTIVRAANPSVSRG